MRRAGPLTYAGCILLVAVFGLSCVRAIFPSGGAREDGGAGEEFGGGFPYQGKISVSSLNAAWTTSNTIRWTWTRAGAASDFGVYELVVALSEEDVRSRSGSAFVWTGKQNPELDHFTLPNTSGDDPVVMVMTDLHQPDTTYHGQLVAYDTDGAITLSNIATARTTAPPTAEVILFSEDPTAGYSIPENVVHQTDAAKAYQGEHYYEYYSRCPAGQVQCWENLRRQDIGRSIAAITREAFETTAFYEIAVACSGMHSFYSHMRLYFGDDEQPSGIFVNPGWSIRCDSQYRLLQIPLRELYGDDLPLPFEETTRKIHEFGVGGAWGHNSWVRLDEARIRW